MSIVSLNKHVLQISYHINLTSSLILATSLTGDEHQFQFQSLCQNPDGVRFCVGTQLPPLLAECSVPHVPDTRIGVSGG